MDYTKGELCVHNMCIHRQHEQLIQLINFNLKAVVILKIKVHVGSYSSE